MSELSTNQPNPASAEPGNRQEWHLLLDDSGAHPLTQLSDHTGLSKQALKRAMRLGALWCGHGKHRQRWRRVDKPMRPGTAIDLYYDARILAQIPPSPTLIVDEDAYSIWHKPYGLCAQGSKWGDHFAIDRWIGQHLQPQRPAFIVHRLDRAARGLMVIAHRKRIAAALSAQFQQRTVEKRYQAIVHGRLAQPVRVDQPIEGRRAISHFTAVQYSATSDVSLLDIRIETGRKHQIRRHLAGLDLPIVGDRLYGLAGDDTLDLQLCAYLLEFDCPVDQRRKHFELPAEHRLKFKQE